MFYSGFVVCIYFMLVLLELVLCCWKGLWLFIKKLRPMSITSPVSCVLLWSPCRVPVPSPSRDAGSWDVGSWCHPGMQGPGAIPFAGCGVPVPSPSRDAGSHAPNSRCCPGWTRHLVTGRDGLFKTSRKEQKASGVFNEFLHQQGKWMKVGKSLYWLIFLPLINSHS